MDNTGPGGTLDTDKVLRGILQYRNTPDPVTGLSPAEVVFGRQIRDFTPVLPGKFRPRDEWRRTLEKREDALTKRHFKDHERWSEHTKRLPPLRIGDHVYIQNQTGNYGRRWDKSGVIVEVRQHDQYLVKKDGSGIPTLRNRRFLRKFTPYNLVTKPQSLIPVVNQLVTRKPEEDTAPDVQSSQVPPVASTPHISPPVSQTVMTETMRKPEPCKGKDHPPPLTPNSKSVNPSPVRKSETVTNVEVESSTEAVVADKSPVAVRARADKNLPRTRLDLTASRDALETTRSGRKVKPVDRLGISQSPLRGEGDRD